MLRLLARKFLLILLLVPTLHLLGFLYATTHPIYTGEPITYSEYLTTFFSDGLGRVGSAPVSEILATNIQNSLVLLVLTLISVVFVGPLLGFVSIRRRTKRITPIATLITTAGSSMPGFFLGVAILAGMLYGVFGLSSSVGTILPISGFGLDEHLILPVLVLASGPTLQVARITASLIENELQQDYIRVAQSKGLNWRGVFWRHAIPNVAAAIISTIGRSMRIIIGGLIVVEALFSWPGIGRIFTYSVGVRLDGRQPFGYFLHPELIAMLAVVFGLSLLLADLIASIAAYGADPRLRQTEVSQ